MPLGRVLECLPGSTSLPQRHVADQAVFHCLGPSQTRSPPPLFVPHEIADVRYYPIELDLTDRRVVVVGLGRVGRRKAIGLVAAGATVVAFDPIPAEPPAGVILVAEPYRVDHLRGAALAFAAATPEVNRRVVADAREADVWVNAASEPDHGDFLVPASWRDGPIGLTVSTSGASPALAAALRDRAAQALGPAPARLATALAELRAEVRSTLSENARKLLLAEWDDPKWLKLAESEFRESLLARLRACMAGYS